MTTANFFDCVLIPVPAAQAGTFVRLRDRILAGEIDAGSLVGDAPVELAAEVPGQGGWTPSMIERLKDRLTYPLVRRLLETCSERPDEWVTKAEIDAFSPNGPLQLRNELGAFSKLSKKLFGRSTWPIEYLKSDDGYRYRMPGAVALLWGSGGM